MSTRERKRRFDALFASYGSDIVAYCCWRSASTSDAQDAAADVFLTAWRRLDEVPEGDATRVWLYATARRVLANQRRSSRRREALHERLAAEEASRPAEQQSSEEALVHQEGRAAAARPHGVGIPTRRRDPVRRRGGPLVNLGSPANIDPDSGTTPAETLPQSVKTSAARRSADSPGA